MLSTLVIASVTVSNMVADVLKYCENENYKEERVRLLTGQIATIAVISLLLIISKLITLIVFKYTTRDLVNSEMLLCEITRMLVLIISTTLAVPAAELISQKCQKVDEK